MVLLVDEGTDGAGELKLIHASTGFFKIDYSDLGEGLNSVSIELEDTDGKAEQTFSIRNSASLLGTVEVNNPLTGNYIVYDNNTPSVKDVLD